MTRRDLFFNRELSWLEFNQRVLEEARDSRNALMDRLRFLAITASNLDEFTMVRVGGLCRSAGMRVEVGENGESPRTRLRQVIQRMRLLVRDQYLCLAALERELATQGIRRRRFNDLDPEQVRHIGDIFRGEIFPLLTPVAVPTVTDFPHVPGLVQCLAVRMASGPGRPRHPLAVLAIPRGLARFIVLPASYGHDYILLEEVIRGFIAHCFPGERILDTALFRLTRNADLEVQEEMSEDFLAAMSDILQQRRDSPCIRMELAQPVGAGMESLLRRALGLAAGDVFPVSGPLALDGFFSFASDARFAALRAPPWDPQPPAALEPAVPMFDAIARRDVLVCHPFESFDPILRFFNEAADDPQVLAIKAILYRTSAGSPVIAALRRAAERGKQVTVLVELKARFSEARNIDDARLLEQSGVQVLYGIKGLKTHAKLCIVIRREAGGIRRYLHFGTGNFNEITARIYTDVSYLTCDEDLAADASLFFNTITGYTQPVRYRKIEAAPIGLRDRLLELIAAETLLARRGQKARIVAKINSLVDRRIIRALYDASQAGVKVRLIVRGICCLRPGVKKLSENIKVVSIIDRFLEHSRIIYFRHGDEPQVFITSADWMPRNLDRRIELLVPVDDPAARQRLVALLDTCLGDNTKAWRLGSDGSYARNCPDRDERPLRCQEELYRQARSRARRAAHDRRQQFTPHRSQSGENTH